MTTENYAPIWQIVLRLLVIVPMQIFRFLFAAMVFVGWGWRSAVMVWEDMA